ncbi:hypothetical protein B0H11DRAFT_2262786 [Mycena galericulata]|nr:hypothetical protein B0H11DRAFT_2262786 [Mycena galericulata]
MSSAPPPPPYSDDAEFDLAEILGLLDDLTLDASPPGDHNARVSPVSLSTRPVQQLSTLRPQTPPPPPTATNSEALYYYESPTQSGYTPHWDVAAHATQAVPGGMSRRLHNKQQSGGKRRGYAVFVGLQIGAFRHWEEARPYVDGVSGSLYQGYGSFEAATAAFEYARVRSWTRQCGSAALVSSSATSVPVVHVPRPIGASETPNPLHTGVSWPGKGVWYVVYSGIIPGVYQSSLECSLNTAGVPGAVYDSCGSRDEAVNRFQLGVAGGRVKVITPKYVP